MINERENKNSLNKMSDLEYTKNDTEMMRYRVNDLSYKLGLIAMISSLLGAFICLNSIQPRDWQVIFIILINIVVLLGGFLAAEMVKNYNKKGAIAQLVFGGVCAARIFYIPLLLITHFNSFISLYKLTDLTDEQRSTLAANRSFLGKTIIQSYASESNYAISYLPSSGNFRGGLAIAFFAIAAVCFIVAGIIGYKRAIKLSTYMESLKKNK